MTTPTIRVGFTVTKRSERGHRTIEARVRALARETLPEHGIPGADHVLIGEFGEERRDFVPIAEMPQVMKTPSSPSRMNASTNTMASTSKEWCGPS